MTEFPPPPGAASFRFSVGNVLSASFAIFTSNLLPLFVLAAVVQLPAVVLQEYSSGPERLESGGWFLWMAGNLLSSLLSLVVTSAIVFSVYQRLRGQSLELGRGIRIGLQQLIPVIVVSILTGLAVMVGFFLLVIPAILFSLMFCVAVPATVVERIGPLEAMQRSANLTKGNRWQLLGLGLVLLLIMVVVGVVGGAVGVLGFGEDSIGSTIVISALSVAAGLLQSIGLAVSYYHLRLEKEGLNLDDLAAVFA